MHVLIPRNTTVPTEKSEVFTTSLDNQPFVPVHVVQGERLIATENRSLAQFELTGIPPAPRGVPKIQVTFRIDANGVVSVDAKDMGTNRSQQIQVRPASGLSQDEVDRLISEAAAFRSQDESRRDLAEIKTQAESLLYTTEAALEGYKDLVSDALISQMRNEAEGLREAIAISDREAIISAFQSLEATTMAVAESIYK